MTSNWETLASDEKIDKVQAALEGNGILVYVVNTAEEAKTKVLELIPEGSGVMTMSSQTLENTGINEVLGDSDKFKQVRDEIGKLDKNTQRLEMNQLGAAPEYAVGSVHAVTEDGSCLIASNSGSQLPAYAYAALHVIWVVGTQKLVADTEEGMKRIYDYCLPLEDKRAQEAYGSGSGVNKLLIFNKEVKPDRVTMILVKEKLGF